MIWSFHPFMCTTRQSSQCLFIHFNSLFWLPPCAQLLRFSVLPLIIKAFREWDEMAIDGVNKTCFERVQRNGYYDRIIELLTGNDRPFSRVGTATRILAVGILPVHFNSHIDLC